MFGGVATGKTYSGSHYAIENFHKAPEATGFIGANTYDQLSQATLRELLYWLEEYKIPFVVDKQPPPAWGRVKRTFKKYSNILSVYINGVVSHAFTRVMSDADALRGIEISWYWLDESRDTKKESYEELLRRQREPSGFKRGLITTTTNGEDWTHERFSKARKGQRLFGSMHVPTYEAVRHGFITLDYYETQKMILSPLMAEQELYAKHVNVTGGQAYYAASDRNRRRIAPWGDTVPSRDRPLIIGCDFNFQPSPCVWMVGQIGPALYGPDGEFWGDYIHWFGEISDVQVSTTEMTLKLLSRYPDFMYEIYGDMSGNIGTTSNAGKTDFNHIGETMMNANAVYTISAEQMDGQESKQNPRVRSRVENMNAMFRNAAGEIRMTYDPINCPLFDGDVKMVGWKPTTTLAGRGKLDDGGDKKRTHASDGAGYAIYKKFPPGSKARIIEGIPSSMRPEITGPLR